MVMPKLFYMLIKKELEVQNHLRNKNLFSTANAGYRQASTHKHFNSCVQTNGKCVHRIAFLT